MCLPFQFIDTLRLKTIKIRGVLGVVMCLSIALLRIS